MENIKNNILLLLYSSLIILTVLLYVFSLFSFTKPYKCPDNAKIYKNDYCINKNGTIINKEYDINLYNRGVVMMSVCGFLTAIIISICVVYCCKNKICDNKENKENIKEKTPEYNIDII